MLIAWTSAIRFERDPFDLIIYFAIAENAFQGDELPLLESLGELREISPGKDAMPFGARFVVAFMHPLWAYGTQ
jgi:hypothetical protein